MRPLLFSLAFALLACGGSAPTVAHPAEPTADVGAAPLDIKPQPQPLITPAPATCLEIPAEYIVGCDGVAPPTRTHDELTVAWSAYSQSRLGDLVCDFGIPTPQALDHEASLLANDLRADRCSRAIHDPERAVTTYHLASIYDDANQTSPAALLFDAVALDPRAGALAVHAANQALNALTVRLNGSDDDAREDCLALFGSAVDRYHARFCEPTVVEERLCGALDMLGTQLAQRQQ